MEEVKPDFPDKRWRPDWLALCKVWQNSVNYLPPGTALACNYCLVVVHESGSVILLANLLLCLVCQLQVNPLPYRGERGIPYAWHSIFNFEIPIRKTFYYKKTPHHHTCIKPIMSILPTC